MTENTPQQEPVTEQGAEQQHTVTPEQKHTYRIVSYALLDAAMRYRESFYRDDIEEYRKLLNEFTTQKAGKDGALYRRMDLKDRMMVADYKEKVDKINKSIYGELKRIEDLLKEKSSITYDNYATACGLLMEELMKAGNTTDLLLVAKAYNMGLCDELLKIFKEEGMALNEQYGNHDKNNVDPPVAEQVVAPDDVKLAVVKSGNDSENSEAGPL
jgi:hypothetical protein